MELLITLAAFAALLAALYIAIARRIMKRLDDIARQITARPAPPAADPFRTLDDN